MEENIEKQIKEISKTINDKEFLSKASKEELMGYVFLTEKLNKKLEKLDK